MTAIAAFRTISELVVAADSRQRDLSGNRAPDATKIFVLGHGVFGVTAGMVAYKATDFDLANLAKNLHFDSSALLHLTELEDAIGPNLKNAFSHLRDIHTDKFNRNAELGSHLILVGQLDHRRLMFHLSFSIEGDPQNFRLKLTRHSFPEIMPFERNRIFVGAKGVGEEFKEMWDADALGGRTTVEFARDFVQTQINTGLASVGPPICVLQLTPRADARWFEF